MGDLSRLLNGNNLDIVDCQITPKQLAALLKLIEDGTISGKIAKTVFEDMFATGKEPKDIVKEKGLTQISNEDEIAALVEQIIANNPKVVEDYRSGKGKAVGFLVGQVMKATKGKANPEMVNKLLQEKLS